MIRAIIFDCFGVLYRGSLDHLLDICPPASRQALADVSHASDYGYISREEYIKQVSGLLGISEAMVVSTIDEQQVRNTALLDFVKTLRPQYKTAMMSNIGRGVIPKLFDEHELQELFDAVVLSSDVGATKPHPQIYAATADRLGVLQSECIMIDDMQQNVTGANDAGMTGLLFENTDNLIVMLRKYS
jgi:glucose-1-phosphatase